MAKILFAAIGTAGDLNPFLAIAIELQKRGHEVQVATCPFFRDKVVRHAVGFIPIRPDINYGDPELAALTMDPVSGTEYVLKEILMKSISETYSDLVAASQNVDILISNSLCFAAGIVAEVIKIPWISAVLSPNNFWSAYDPFVLPNALFFRHVHKAGSSVNRLIVHLGKIATRGWLEAIHDLRQELGLPKGGNPLFEGMHSPDLVLGLFSGVFAKTRPDWPEQTVVTGFAMLYEDVDTEQQRKLAAFLGSDQPPVVFTLGTAAVLDPDSFYQHGLSVCNELGQRAIFLTGHLPGNVPQSLTNSSSFFQADYLPFGMLFSKASAIVHHGGIGTVAQVLHSGKPSVVVPYSHDQPDNAVRLKKLGVAEFVPRNHLTARQLRKSLEKIVQKSFYSESAESIKRQICHENGAVSASDVIELKLAEYYD